MHLKKSVVSLAIFASFAAGITAAPFLPQMQSAHAASASMVPQVIDVAALKDADLPLRPGSEMRTLTLFSADAGTVAVQFGTVGKHTHQQSEELQYILEGSGTMWVGSERKQFKPGTLIVIPRGVAHGGASVSYRALAIKLPPQVTGDAQALD